MNLKSSLCALVLVISSAVVAHDDIPSSEEQTQIKNKNLATQNANLRAQVICLQEALQELKHHLPEKHPFHELVKALLLLEKPTN